MAQDCVKDRIDLNHRFSNPVRGRLNAWMLHVTDDTGHKFLCKWKQKIFEDLPNSVVELGPGTGTNLRYYRHGSHLIAIEPNLIMLNHLRRNAERYGITLDIRESKAEKLDLADESAEAVVSTQVLCSVDGLNQVLNEVYRILRPGGRFLFLEHVAAPKETFLRRLQETNLILQSWRWLAEGCRINCEIDSAIESVGFSKIEVEHFEVKSLLPIPIRHFIAGIATK